MRTIAVTAASLVALSLAACTHHDSTAGQSDTPSVAHTRAETEAPVSEPVRIRITIGDKVLDGTLAENPAAAALIDQLPLTLAFKDLNGVEKIADIPEELTMDRMPKGDDPDVGDIGYYAPWGNLVLYYGDVGYWNGIARIGRIHGDLSPIADQSADFTATIELAN